MHSKRQGSRLSRNTAAAAGVNAETAERTFPFSRSSARPDPCLYGCAASLWSAACARVMAVIRSKLVVFTQAGCSFALVDVVIELTEFVLVACRRKVVAIRRGFDIVSLV